MARQAQVAGGIWTGAPFINDADSVSTQVGGSVYFVGTSAEIPVVPEVRPYPGPAGKSRRGRKPLRVRRKHYVEIDNQYFEVAGPHEAEAILAGLRERAQEAAKAAVRKAQRKSRGKVAPAPVAPRLALRDPDYADLWTQHLQAQIDATNAAIAETYRQVALSAAEWLRQEAEDEDVAVLLTMGIL